MARTGAAGKRCALEGAPLPPERAGLRSRRASMLLEVLVTVTIMALFMALIGAQILSSVQAAGAIERRQTAMLLAESLTGRLQAGGFELTDQAQELSGTFGVVYPGWGWRVSSEPTEDPTLMRIHLEALQGDPTQPDATVDSMKIITDTYTFWALPSKMDLAEDFGLPEEATAELAKNGIDVHNFNPDMLAGQDIPSLLKQYPQLLSLLQMYGIDPSMLETLDQNTIRKYIDSYLAANGGALPNIPGLGGAGGDNAGGGSSGAGNAANGAGGNDSGSGNNGNSNNNNNNNSGANIDWNELARLLSSGDKAAAEEYIRSHAGSGGGVGGGNPPSGNEGAGGRNGGGNRGGGGRGGRGRG